MPSQNKIINAVNYCLKLKSNTDFEFNKGGVCAGLAGLYVKYSLEDKTKEFFALINQLSNLPKNYQFGSNEALDDFIIQIEKVFNPAKYNNELRQGNLDKLLFINNTPVKNEFNLGLITDKTQWAALLNLITKENRSYYINSPDHAIALSYKNGTYFIYDPNYNVTTKEFTSPQLVIDEFKRCFGYKEDLIGLAIQSFAHPKDTPAQYPTHKELHDLAFGSEENKTRSTQYENSVYQSTAFASYASDTDTLSYLFNEKAVVWDGLRTEYNKPEFNQELLKQPPTPELKKAILNSLYFNINNGQMTMTGRLIDRYNAVFQSDDDRNDLKGRLNEIFSRLVELQQGFMRRIADHELLLKLCENYLLINDKVILTNYKHLSLLTLLHKEAPDTDYQLLFKDMSPEQLIQQIKLAAQLNQNRVLNVLIKQFDHLQLKPADFPSIYSEELINQIDVGTLKTLLKAGFVADIKNPHLLSLSTLRQDKTIFEAYARSFSEQEHSKLWDSIDTYDYGSLNLEAKIGPVLLINALVFLKKNEHIRRLWNDSIQTETIKEALIFAINSGAVDMSQFLKEKLDARGATLDSETVEFLKTEAIKSEDLSILSILAHLKYNVITNLPDVHKVLTLCHGYNDYSLIEDTFEKLSLPIKKSLLEKSLDHYLKTGVELCARREPQLFSILLNDSLTNPNSAHYKTRINQILNFIPNLALSLSVDEQSQKEFIKSCFTLKLFNLVNALFNQVTWSDSELETLFSELSQAKNEEGLIQLIKSQPKLGQDPEHIKSLIQSNLLKPLELIIKEKIVIEEGLYSQLFLAAMQSNNKNIISLLIEQNRVLPQPQLTELIKINIEKGLSEAIEPFIQSAADMNIDFKELFFWSCQCKQPKLANQLRAKPFLLTEEEIKTSMTQLFGDQPALAFESVYQGAHGRLYELLLKTDISNPRAALMSSIREPEQDLKFKKSELYWAPLKRALKDKTKDKFDAFFNEINLPQEPDLNTLDILKDPFLLPSVLIPIETKYGLEKLLALAIAQNEWIAVAHLIERHKMSDLNTELQKQIHDNAGPIVNSFVQNLKSLSSKNDVRPRLFKLLIPNTNEMALNQIAAPHYEVIKESIEQIESEMIANKQDLNHQIYRFNFGNKSFAAGLEELNQAFEQCKVIIEEQTIDLNAPVNNELLTNKFAQIKSLMAKHDITPYYLGEEQENLLYQLHQNPRFKTVGEQEIKLYGLMKQFDLPQKNLYDMTSENQKEFSDAFVGMHQELIKQNLPNSFVLNQLQPYLNFYNHKVQGIKGINQYLEHRGSTLSIVPWIFDYDRGEVRANHYKNLMRSAKTSEELHILHYAILTNSDGQQLKNDMAKGLGYTDLEEAKQSIKGLIIKSKLGKNSAMIDELIDSINQKANDDDSTPTSELFANELACLRHLCREQSALVQHSIFKPQLQPRSISWREWFSNLFGTASSSDSDKLAP